MCLIQKKVRGEKKNKNLKILNENEKEGERDYKIEILNWRC